MRDYALTENDLIVIGDGDDKESAVNHGIRFFNVGEGRGAASNEKIYELQCVHALLKQRME